MSKYKLSQEKVNFIKKHFFEFSFDNDEAIPDKKLFEELSHPAELFYLADIYNWDDGIEVLKWVVDSPLCSEATANLVFWRAQPDYYRRYNIEGVNSTILNDGEVLALLAAIIKKHERVDFCAESISFDPEPEIEVLTAKEPKWDVPEALYRETKGFQVHVD